MTGTPTHEIPVGWRKPFWQGLLREGMVAPEPVRSISRASRSRDGTSSGLGQLPHVSAPVDDPLLQQRADRTPQLVERRRPPARQRSVESGSKRRLICGRPVSRLHVPPEPLLGATNRLRVGRCNEVAGERAVAGDGFDGSEEPRLVLTLRQDCFDTPIRARSAGACKESGTKTRRTRSVGVQQDQECRHRRQRAAQRDRRILPVPLVSRTSIERRGWASRLPEA